MCKSNTVLLYKALGQTHKLLWVTINVILSYYTSCHIPLFFSFFFFLRNVPRFSHFWLPIKLLKTIFISSCFKIPTISFLLLCTNLRVETKKSSNEATLGVNEALLAHLKHLKGLNANLRRSNYSETRTFYSNRETNQFFPEEVFQRTTTETFVIV